MILHMAQNFHIISMVHGKTLLKDQRVQIQEWMHVVAYLNAWAIDGFNGILIYGYGLDGILKELIVLLLMGSVFSGIAYKRFKLD